MNRNQRKLIKKLESALQNLTALSFVFRREENDKLPGYQEEFKRNKMFAMEYIKKLKKDLALLKKNGIPLPVLFRITNIKNAGDVALFSKEIDELKFEKLNPGKALVLTNMLKDDFGEIHDALQKAIFFVEKGLPFETSEKQDIKVCGSFTFNFTNGEIKGNNLNTQFKFKDNKYKLLKLLMNPVGKIRTYEEIAKIYGRSESSTDFEYELRDDIKKIKIALKILPRKKKKNKDIFGCNKGYYLKCK